MSHYQLAFNSPWYLLLLAVLPLLWWFSFRSLAGLGHVRRLMAIVLRTVVLLLLVLAIAEMQWVEKIDRLTVLFLLDQSQSISGSQSDLMREYVNQSIKKQRDRDHQDRAGVIVFGREAAIELPPLDDDQQIKTVESLVDREYTNLAGAMKLAQACFPHDAAKRIVIVSDGNENLGNGLDQARSLVDADIGIDVVPVRTISQGEVAVEKVVLPADIRRGTPFDLRVVLNNSTKEDQDRRPLEGKLQIVRKTGDHEETLVEKDVALPPGKRVFSIREKLDEPDFYTYEARWIPKNPAEDTFAQNNQASQSTHIQGSGQVLLIEDYENKGEFDQLVQRLRLADLEVTVRSSRPEDLFTDLAQLQPFDTVLLANVPREHFTDDQIEMLVRNTQNLGSGLVMLGGPNSFGAGGWTNTRLEEAMPVDFQIKSAKVEVVGALVMLMHATELPNGNHWQKVIAHEAIKSLGNQDLCGVLHWGDFNGNESWLWAQQGSPKGMLPVGPNRKQMLAKLDQMTPGDMPQFESSMLMALNSFKAISNQKKAAVKHMIVISDGDPSPPSSGVMNGLAKLGVKVSTVAIGTHGAPGSTVLKGMATSTKGKYYVVTNPNMLPRIYQREARRVARPLVYERAAGFQPQIRFQHEMLQGISDQLPPITGYVMTSVKEGPLPEISVVAPEPIGMGSNTIVASWTYGLGKTAVFTSDAGKRWTTAWTGWEGYDKLFSQLVRWSMRPVGDLGKFTVSTDVQDGKVKLAITALDKDDQFANFLQFGGSVVGPDMKTATLDVRQTAPGRYVGEFDVQHKGSYFVMLNPGAGRPPIRVGVNVPYSDEFREHETNEGLLKNLAGMATKQGVTGKVIDVPKGVGDPQQQIAGLLETNPFRHDLPQATSTQDIWPWLVFCGSCLFFFDVFVRRVTVSFAWVPPLAAAMGDLVLRRQREAAPNVTMERLRSRKAQVTDEIEQKRAAGRFEAAEDRPVDVEVLREPTASPTARQQQQSPGGLAAPEKDKTEESYTSRLLKAKQKVWEDREKNKPES